MVYFINDFLGKNYQKERFIHQKSFPPGGGNSEKYTPLKVA
jgi:hypothetical protein